MARGGNIGYKRKTKNKVQLETKGSDESDEDYKVDEDEEFDESEDDCSSLAEDESEECLGLFVEEEEEEEWVEKKVKKIKKVGKPRGQKGFQARKKESVVMPRKKKVFYSKGGGDDDDDYSYGSKRRKRSKVSYKEEEDDDIEVLYRQEESEFVEEKPRQKSRVCRKELYRDSRNDNPKERDEVSYEEENEDSDYDDSYDEDEEEFSPDEVLQKTRRKTIKNRFLRRKNRYNVSKEFKEKNPTSQKKKTTKRWGLSRRRKSNEDSDSDFMSSGSSDYEYTISEEEREQVKEATEFCGRLTTSLRSSRSLKMFNEEEVLPSKGKRLPRKGKQRVVEMKIEVGKQVCGICLSEEGKRTVRGVLNCCSHYFCFACIMEWSKVESRCPLCKQRFATISRTARTEDGHDFRDAVFPVPERDQVYQPSEEELRGYLDPYENVLCTECLQGGDDALMLLCDLCDSPAHTYCVGLGHEVPDGNWYCDGCRPTALVSTNAQALNPVPPDHGASNNLSVGSSPVTSVRETFDLNEAYVPDTPLTQGTGLSQSPSVGHFQASSPVTGSGAFTLFERRRIQRQIHQLLNNRNRQSDRSDVTPASGINLFGNPIGRNRVIATQNTVIPARTALQNIYLRGRFPDHYTPSYGREVFSPRLSSLRGEALCNQASTSTDQSFGGLLSEFSGINARIGSGLGHPQLHPCSGGSNTGADATSPYQFREEFVTVSREATVPSRTLRLNP